VSHSIIARAVRAAFQGSAAALLTVAALPLHAQQSNNPDGSNSAATEGLTPGDVVIVTGSSGSGKRTKIRAGYSITTIGEDALRMQAPTSVTEALKSVPGF